MEKFYECGICECIHPWEWNGDCREDAARFFCDTIPPDAELYPWQDRLEADQITLKAARAITGGGLGFPSKMPGCQIRETLAASKQGEQLK